MVRLLNFQTKVDKTGVSKPIVCTICNTVQDRLDNHLIMKHKQIRHSNEYKQHWSMMVAHSMEVLRNIESESYAKDPRQICVPLSTPIATSTWTSTSTLTWTSTSTSSITADSKYIKTFHRRGNITISPTKKGWSLLVKARMPSNDQKRYWGIRDGKFNRYHQTAADSLHDFDIWLQRYEGLSKTNARAHIQKLNNMWLLVDPSLNLFPNSLAHPENIEDNYFLPCYRKLMQQKDLPTHMQTPCIQPGTIKSCFGAVARYVRFLSTRFVFAGINEKQIQNIKEKLVEMQKTLNKLEAAEARHKRLEIRKLDHAERL